MRYLVFLALVLSGALLAAPPPFTTDLPAELVGKTDLWLARLEPSPGDPEGGLYMVQRRFLGRYSDARARGYPWSWAPLPAVFDAFDRSTQPPSDLEIKAERAESERLRARIRAAVSILQPPVNVAP